MTTDIEATLTKIEQQVREITQPSGMNYAGDAWEYTVKDYREMAHTALALIPTLRSHLRAREERDIQNIAMGLAVEDFTKAIRQGRDWPDRFEDSGLYAAQSWRAYVLQAAEVATALNTPSPAQSPEREGV